LQGAAHPPRDPKLETTEAVPRDYRHKIPHLHPSATTLSGGTSVRHGAPRKERLMLHDLVSANHDERISRTTSDAQEAEWRAREGERFLIAGVVVSFIDVTKLKETEAALRQAVGEREGAEQSLRDADLRKNEFLAVLSHELRNPLAPIRNSLHILERAPADAGAAQRGQEIIARQVGHLARLVDDLLDVTRISNGKLQIERRPLDLRDLSQRTAEDHGTVFTPVEWLSRSSCRTARCGSRATRPASRRSSATCSRTRPSSPAAATPSGCHSTRSTASRCCASGTRASASSPR